MDKQDKTAIYTKTCGMKLIEYGTVEKSSVFPLYSLRQGRPGEVVVVVHSNSPKIPSNKFKINRSVVYTKVVISKAGDIPNTHF